MSKNLYMKKIGERAKLASLHLSNVNIDRRNSVLKQFSQYLKSNSRSILNSNKKDLSILLIEEILPVQSTCPCVVCPDICFPNFKGNSKLI